VPTLLSGDDAELQIKKLELAKQLETVEAELDDLEDRKARLEKRLATQRMAQKGKASPAQGPAAGAGPASTVNI